VEGEKKALERMELASVKSKEDSTEEYRRAASEPTSKENAERKGSQEKEQFG